MISKTLSKLPPTKVVLERLQHLRIPVVTGFPFGHRSSHNHPLPLGTQVRLDANHGFLEFLEALRNPGIGGQAVTQ